MEKLVAPAVRDEIDYSEVSQNHLPCKHSLVWYTKSEATDGTGASVQLVQYLTIVKPLTLSTTKFWQIRYVN